MARRVFFSFHFENDAWRAGQVRNMGALDGNEPVSDNDWEAIRRHGDAAIRSWIDSQLSGRSCVVVLIGSQTAGRKWIDYEIRQAWSKRKGLLGVHVYGLKDRHEQIATKGRNPFGDIQMQGGGTMADHVSVFDPTSSDSATTYGVIKRSLAAWVEAVVS